MLVSWKWLSRYIDLPSASDELAERLSLSGLNHEGTEKIGEDLVIDLEVTSNRGDCLGHLGVAREISVLYDLPSHFPDPSITEPGDLVDKAISIDNRFVDACPRYTARVIRGVTVGPSPEWLVELLGSVGLATVNNIVDVTNFVMLECGQPLHAFDLKKIGGDQVIIRPARQGEKIEAIDHHEYTLDDSMPVIADANRPIAIAGVMGGATTEVTSQTCDLLIEAAIFRPLSVRRTSRRLKLGSHSSFRFERRVDPQRVDWASRRACQLITELAGGQIAKGLIDTAPTTRASEPIVLRLSQLKRVLGIDVERQEVVRILTKLGCQANESSKESCSWNPPSWRHDLRREVDLIEEIARIHGYDQIPENSPISVAPSSKRTFDSAMEAVRHVLTAMGISEAMTPSVVTENLDQMLSPWTDRESLSTQVSMLDGARRLRRSLLPSLLDSCAANWAASSIHADLFEIAHTYLPGKSETGSPNEQYSLGIVTGYDYRSTKGIFETLLTRLGVQATWNVEAEAISGFSPGIAARMVLEDQLLGFMGEVDIEIQQRLKIPRPMVAMELSIPVLLANCRLVPQFQTVSPFPSIVRDLNFVLDESVLWNRLENVVRQASGPDLVEVHYRETYRDPSKDGVDRKRVLLSIELQKSDTTLTGGDADRIVDAIVDRCARKLNASLLA